MKYLFIGSSAAALSALQAIARADAEAELVMLTAQREQPNNTCVIKDVLAGVRSKQDTFLPFTSRVQLYTQKKVVAIEPESRQVFTSSGERFAYDQLIVAVGTCPRVPAGVALGNGVFTYHNLDDVVDIVNYIEKASVKTVAVIGAGLSGIEAALACSLRGLSVTLVEKELTIAPHEPEDTQVRLHELLAHKQVEIKTGTIDFPAADLTLLALGGRPETDFLKGACQIDAGGYVVQVHEQYQESIQVIGDCVAQPRIRNGWARALLAGKKIIEQRG